MVSVIFAVLEVSFWALTTVVELPWKFLTLIFAVLLQFFAARCYASAALAVMRCPSICLLVCLSRSYMHSVKTNKHFFNFFHLVVATPVHFFVPNVTAIFWQKPPTQRERRKHAARGVTAYWSSEIQRMVIHRRWKLNCAELSARGSCDRCL